jgi:hypothetical protein
MVIKNGHLIKAGSGQTWGNHSNGDGWCCSFYLCQVYRTPNCEPATRHGYFESTPNHDIVSSSSYSYARQRCRDSEPPPLLPLLLLLLLFMLLLVTSTGITSPL